MVSRTGDALTTITLLWFVLELTGSGTAVGLVILCFQLPRIMTGPLAGKLLDRYSPRWVIGVDNLLRALVIGAIPSLYWLGFLEMWSIYALTLVAGILSPATEIGVRVLIPLIVTEDELEGANALWSLSWEFAALTGPVAAGFLVEGLGGPTVLFIDAATFLLMGVLILTLLEPHREQKSTEYTEGSNNWLGFGTLWRMKEVRVVTALTIVFFFAYGPLEVALPVYSRQTIDAGPSGYGLMWTAFGVGSVFGLLSIGRVSKFTRPGVMLALIAILWGTFLFPPVFLQSLPTAMLFLCLAGFVWSPYNVMDTSLVQRLVPAHLRGQVFGVRSTFNAVGAPLGAALGGVALDHLPAPTVIGLSAVACIATGTLGLLSPTLRGIRRSVKASERDEATAAGRTDAEKRRTNEQA